MSTVLPEPFPPMPSLFVLALTGACLLGCETDPPSGATTAEVSDAVLDTTDAALFDRAAATAWRFVELNTVEGTGLVQATDAYEHVTTWDIGSMLAAVVSAEGLGIVARSEAERRLGAILESLSEVDLYDGANFNKSYSARTLRMNGRGDRPNDTGQGWSVLDIGRLLVWLRIVADEFPGLSARAEAVAGRLDYDRLVVDGYLTGEDLDAGGKPRTYMEGRIGYEQYAAEGFALWGHDAQASRDVYRHAVPLDVLGVPLLADERGNDRLTSEPMVLLALEVGWTPAIRELAWKVLAAQEARYRETGTVTMVSEDAVNIPPHYFYYYGVVGGDGEAFLVDAQGPMSGEGPRWISTKAAYAWHAVLPGPYTRTAVKTVEAARTSTGWASGVFEGSGQSTGVRNINTAAIVLEAAYFARHGVPIRHLAGR